MKTLHLDLGERGYDINIGRGLISHANEFFNLERRVLILTDTGVPKEYAIQVKNLCRDAEIFTISQGEDHKTIETISMILSKMLEIGMTRTDCVVAVGGGIVGDVAGFAASIYMRGIDFYNIPTTLLSQVDSSIGGKTGVNLKCVKNIVGAFYQPKGVIIDPDLLSTLPQRQISNGIAEIIKMAVCCDGELFDFMKNYHPGDAISEEIILGSLQIKKQVVEADEKEGGIRRVLNFGHTLGHAIEAKESDKLYHGECVAIGMTAVCSKKVKAELIPLLRQVGLPTKYSGNLDDVLANIKHDKKCAGDSISCVYVDEIGKFRIEKTEVEHFCSQVKLELEK